MDFYIFEYEKKDVQRYFIFFIQGMMNVIEICFGIIDSNCLRFESMRQIIRCIYENRRERLNNLLHFHLYVYVYKLKIISTGNR